MPDLDPTDDDLRAFAHSLFAPDVDPEPDEHDEPQHGNVVPREGTIPTERPDEERAAARALFGYDPA